MNTFIAFVMGTIVGCLLRDQIVAGTKWLIELVRKKLEKKP